MIGLSSTDYLSRIANALESIADSLDRLVPPIPKNYYMPPVDESTYASNSSSYENEKLEEIKQMNGFSNDPDQESRIIDSIRAQYGTKKV